jgi:SnoaL-like polyketide cyclase
LTWHHSAFLDQQFTVDDILAADEAAACRWTLTGTHSGPFLGVEMTARHVEVSGMDFFHISRERITEFWRSMDLRALLNQLEAASVMTSLSAMSRLVSSLAISLAISRSRGVSGRRLLSLIASEADRCAAVGAVVPSSARRVLV